MSVFLLLLAYHNLFLLLNLSKIDTIVSVLCIRSRGFIVRTVNSVKRCDMHASVITDCAPGNRCSIIQQRSRRACVLAGRAIQLTFEDVCIYTRRSLFEINLRLRFEVGDSRKKSGTAKSASCVKFPPSCTYDRCAGLIGFAKLITRIYISPRKRFSFLPCSPGLRPCLPSADRYAETDE